MEFVDRLPNAVATLHRELTGNDFGARQAALAEVAESAHGVLVADDSGDSPYGEVLRDRGVRVVVYPNDQAPPHAHVIGGGPETRVGLNGKPLDVDPELTPQQQVVEAARGAIHDAIGESKRAHRENQP